MIEWQGKLLPMEVKATFHPRLADAGHLLTYREEYKRTALPALLVHAGDEVRWLAEGVLAVPWWMLI